MVVPKQINSDRTAPGTTTSAVCGVEVNLSCDYKMHFPGSRCYPDTDVIMYVQMLQARRHTQSNAPTDTKKKRPGEQKEENVCFPNRSLLAPTAVRPV